MADLPADASIEAEKPKDDEALLKEIRELFHDDLACEEDNWKKAGDDLRFLALDQWNKDAAKERDAENRPWLTFDLIGEKEHQITGDMRMNKPSIKVRPVEDGDEDKAEIFEGLVRHIEQQSDAGTAYNTAGISAVRCGIGNFRVVTQFTDDESFEQEIRIQRISNPFAVVWDGDAQEVTREDAKHAWVLSRMSKTAFEAMWPGASTQDFDTPSPERQGTSWTNDWYKNDKITVAEFFRKEPVTKKIGLTQDGQSIDITDMGPAELAQAGVTRTRDVKTHKVVQYIVNGAEILSGPNEWAGKYIPIVPVWGEEIDTGDEVIRFGVTRRAKDPQRTFNTCITAAVETMMLSPKAPFIGTVAQFTGLSRFWDEAHKQNTPYLPYNADPNAPGPPQRSQPPTLNVAAIQIAQMAADGVKSGMGMHDASIGARSNETSGKAILARQKEGDVGSYVYVDNLAKAVAYCGRILVDLIPKIYDTERMVRVLGEDGAQTFERVNATTHPETKLPMPHGQLFNDLSIGTYDVVVETGPSFSTKRAEAADTMMQFLQSIPDAAPLIMDLVVKNIDMPGAEEMRQRLRKGLPPGVAEPEDGDPPPPDPQQAIQAQVQAESQLKDHEIETQTKSKLTLQEQKHHHDMELADHKAATTMEHTIVSAKVGGHEAKQADTRRGEHAAQADERRGKQAVDSEERRGQQAVQQAAIKGHQSKAQMTMKGEQAAQMAQMRGQQFPGGASSSAKAPGHTPGNPGSTPGTPDQGAIQQLVQAQQEQGQMLQQLAQQMQALVQALTGGGQPPQV